MLSLARQRLHEALHATSQVQHHVQHALLQDVAVAVFKRGSITAGLNECFPSSWIWH